MSLVSTEINIQLWLKAFKYKHLSSPAALNFLVHHTALSIENVTKFNFFIVYKV